MNDLYTVLEQLDSDLVVEEIAGEMIDLHGEDIIADDGDLIVDEYFIMLAHRVKKAVAEKLK